MHDYAAAKMILKSARKSFPEKQFSKMEISIGKITTYSSEALDYYLGIIKKKEGFKNCEFLYNEIEGNDLKITGVEFVGGKK